MAFVYITVEWGTIIWMKGFKSRPIFERMQLDRCMAISRWNLVLNKLTVNIFQYTYHRKIFMMPSDCDERMIFIWQRVYWSRSVFFVSYLHFSNCCHFSLLSFYPLRFSMNRRFNVISPHYFGIGSGLESNLGLNSNPSPNPKIKSK